MGTDRTSAEICLQGVGPLTDLIALDAHDPRDAAVQTGNDVPDLVDFADAGFNGFVRHRIEAKRRAQPVDRANGQRNIRSAEAARFPLRRAAHLAEPDAQPLLPALRPVEIFPPATTPPPRTPSRPPPIPNN